LGAVVSISSLFAIRTPHNYHRAARDRRRRVEDFVSPGRPWDWGVRQVVVAGGETSGAVVSALDVRTVAVTA
jgi:hypothetical protein